MINIDFIKNFVTYENLPFIQRGDTIPFEVIQFMKGKPLTRFKSLFLPQTKEIDTSIPYYIEYKCPGFDCSCGNTFTTEASRRDIEVAIEYDEVVRRFSDSSIIYHGSRLCEACEAKVQKIYEEDKNKTMAEYKERERLDNERRKLQAEKEEELVSGLIAEYLTPCKEDVEISPLIFSQLKEKILNIRNSSAFQSAVKACYESGSLPQTKYWAIVKAEKQRQTEHPACVITGETANLSLIYADEKDVGQEFHKDNLSFLVYVSDAALQTYSREEIVQSMRKERIIEAKNNKYCYHYRDLFDFGKYDGYCVGDIFNQDKRYILWLRKNIEGFDIIDDFGLSLFDRR